MDEIKNFLIELQKTNKIDIIFACEAGSRLWRIDSSDSDFDIRFVFKRNFRDYLRLNKPNDIIQCVSGNKDFVGFDIFKFCGLLNNSNPSIIEWLISDIVYFNKQPGQLVSAAKNWFNPLALFHHYKSMCKQNYLTYLKTHSEVTYKKYLYAMRGLLSAKYVLEFEELPPINFNILLEKLFSKNAIQKEIYHKLKEILVKKKSGKEGEIIQNVVKIDHYIEENLKDLTMPPSKKNLLLIKEINKYILKELGIQ